MRAFGFHKSKLLIVLALICAMASTGFAHRFVSEPLDPGLADYVAAGGSLADICGDVESAHHYNGQTCDACRLINPAVLPEHDTPFTTPTLRSLTGLSFGGEAPPRPTSQDWSKPVRGPPTA